MLSMRLAVACARLTLYVSILGETHKHNKKLFWTNHLAALLSYRYSKFHVPINKK
jgi:hypothetical protein